jgi:hypothetical protein
VPEVVVLLYYMNEWKEIAMVLAAFWIPISAFWLLAVCFKLDLRLYI